MSNKGKEFMNYDGVARAVYIKQMQETQLQNLHNWEINRKRTVPPFQIMREYNLRSVGNLTEEEWNNVYDEIAKHKPSIKDNEDGWYNPLEYAHAFDWNIYHQVLSLRVGKLKKMAESLINKVE